MSACFSVFSYYCFIVGLMIKIQLELKIILSALLKSDKNLLKEQYRASFSML